MAGSTLSDLYKEIVLRPLPLPEKYYVDEERWFRARAEIEEHPLSKSRGVLCADISELNFLLAGIPVCIDQS